MATSSYRIHFIASFDVTIDAPDIATARKVATEMQGLPWGSWAAAADAHDVRVRWNTIKLVVADAAD